MSLSLRDVNKGKYNFPDGYDSIGKTKRTQHPSANAKPLFAEEQLPHSIDAIFAPLEENKDYDDDVGDAAAADAEYETERFGLRSNSVVQQIGEFAPIEDFTRDDSRMMYESMGTSLRLDSQGVVKYSIREDSMIMHTPPSNRGYFLPSVMTSFSGALDMLYELVHDSLMVPSNYRYAGVDIDAESESLNTNLFIIPLQRKICHLVDVLVHLNHLELTLEVFKQWGDNVVDPEQYKRFDACLHEILELVANFVNEDQHEATIFQSFMTSKDFARKFKFSHIGADALDEVRPLLTLANTPQLTLQSFNFDVQLIDNDDTSLQEELRYHLNYMLAYQLLIQKLKGFFINCLSFEQNEDSGIVLHCLEGFLTNSVELDSAELLVGLDTAIDAWARKDHDRSIVLASWCNEMARKQTKLGQQAEEDDDTLGGGDKYNVAKLFIQQLKDITAGHSVSSGFTILTAGLDSGAAPNSELVLYQNQSRNINIKRWVFGQQKSLSHKQRLLEKCHKLKWKFVKWSQGFSRKKQTTERRQYLASRGNNSELVSLSISGSYHNWRNAYHNPAFNNLHNGSRKLGELQDRAKKIDEFKRKRDRLMFLFFGEDA
ncbi:AaceriACL179Cp [[Ashbya] aceris (nom. inval.)]|nr:AaceriACL179Cp [[Ashbya] aceris (nom. inval.)]